MPHPSELSCAVCTKRHETGNPAAPLECHALPPRQDVSTFAVYPRVRPNGFCHVYFQFDEAAGAARAEAVAQAAALDAKVAMTQAAAPLLGEDGQPANPPLGDLADALASPQPIAPAPKRARRARGSDEPSLL